MLKAIHLLEVLIVVLIIAILLCIAIPNAYISKEQSKKQLDAIQAKEEAQFRLTLPRASEEGAAERTESFSDLSKTEVSEEEFEE